MACQLAANHQVRAGDRRSAALVASARMGDAVLAEGAISRSALATLVPILCARHKTAADYWHAVSSFHGCSCVYAQSVKAGEVPFQGVTVDFSASMDSLEYQLGRPSVSVIHGDPTWNRAPLIRASSIRGARDYGHVTLRDRVTFYRARWESWRRNHAT